MKILSITIGNNPNVWNTDPGATNSLLTIRHWIVYPYLNLFPKSSYRVYIAICFIHLSAVWRTLIFSSYFIFLIQAKCIWEKTLIHEDSLTREYHESNWIVSNCIKYHSLFFFSLWQLTFSNFSMKVCMDPYRTPFRVFSSMLRFHIWLSYTIIYSPDLCILCICYE